MAAADEKAEKIIVGMKQGQAMKIKYSLPRNYGNHKRFFAFIKIAFGIQDHFQNIEHFRHYIEMKAGAFSEVEAPNGYKLYLPKSIAFDKMDETEFRELFDKCIDAFVEIWGDRIEREQLEAIVEFS